MALVKCKECGREISDQAPTCPGCGAPIAVALGIPTAWVTPPPPPPVPPSQPPAPPPPPSVRPAGQPTPPKKASGCGTVLLWCFAGLVILLVLGKCSELLTKSDAPTSTTPTQAAPAQTPERKKELAAKDALLIESDTTSRGAKVSIAENLIRSYPGTPEAKRASELLDKLKADLAEEERGKQWDYSASEDGMSGKQVYSGSVVSTNSFEFDFPYQGQQRSKLTLRHHPRWGNDVILSIEKGQILCHTYECAVRVRFDDGAPQTFTGTEPADNSSESVFIPAYGTFAKRLQNAKRVRIEVNIYQHGVLVSDFDVNGFKTNKLRGDK